MLTEAKAIKNVLGDPVHYYEVRMNALSEYSDRVWNRFNWFLTLQLAIFGFYFTQIDKLSLQPLIAKGIPIVGITISVLWCLMGAEDYVSMRKHGKRTLEVENKVKEAFLQEKYDFEVSVRRSFIRFRQTWLLFLFPILVTGAWFYVAIL
ncbi:MAG: hypothetical protein OMM_12003 [Candidatus Magnetoglobus multicellularis str. Araruama]|uniref:SMODS and SLOG-associating 2TM effector domain-containing protein n=1 Tax=Candidatus Magnetoglobus multicellularis str. Araruama TaxID=890399 RepID=A0A1V1NWY1_9BACT|nr:MAG: hypothetical protein OMM_12003 [Candidatus Magnetoglobus multicellularis str. Araruama]